MGSLSIWHWVVTILFFASPIMGIVRGVKNGAAIHSMAPLVDVKRTVNQDGRMVTIYEYTP
jgi:hypothetical protein